MLILALAPRAWGQQSSSTFTYQGAPVLNGSPVNGGTDLISGSTHRGQRRFPIWQHDHHEDLIINNGLLAVNLNFGCRSLRRHGALGRYSSAAHGQRRL